MRDIDVTVDFEKVNSKLLLSNRVNNMYAEALIK